MVVLGWMLDWGNGQGVWELEIKVEVWGLYLASGLGGGSGWSGYPVHHLLVIHSLQHLQLVWSSLEAYRHLLLSYTQRSSWCDTWLIALALALYSSAGWKFLNWKCISNTEEENYNSNLESSRHHTCCERNASSNRTPKVQPSMSCEYQQYQTFNPLRESISGWEGLGCWCLYHRSGKYHYLDSGHCKRSWHRWLGRLDHR